MISPIDGSVVAERPIATPDQVEAVLRRADAARAAWAATPLVERAAKVELAVQYMLDHADEVGLEMTVQMGRPVGQSPNEIRRGFQERARMMARVARGIEVNFRHVTADGGAS